MQFAGIPIDRTHLRGLDDNSLYRLLDRVKSALAAAPAPGRWTQADRERSRVADLIAKEFGRRKLPR
jgi:hypothetical protein